MSVASALVKVWNETAAAFSGSGYSLFTIEANIVCTIILAILFNRQQNSSEQTESGILWGRLLFVQILYCLSGVLRELADIGIFPHFARSLYLITALNLALFGCMFWLVFLYMEYSQKSGLLDTWEHKILAALPFAVHLVMLALSFAVPYFIETAGGRMKPGAFFPIMLAMNLIYPLASVCSALLRRRKMTRYERETLPVAALYPVLLVIFTPIQSMNWRLPLMCYVIVIADIVVYLSHSDSLILVDPLTKIPNRNGLLKALTDRLGQDNPETLHVFAVDIEDMSTINSLHGRIEGDKALVLTAEALKKFSSKEHPCFVSRYYGDEFILTADIQDDEERDLFIEHIRNYVNNTAIANRLAYHLKVSIGWAKYEQFSRTETISGLIEEADSMLIENREQRRFQNIWGNV